MSSQDTSNPTIDKPTLLKGLSRILTPEALLHTAEDLRPYECDGLSAYRKLPLAVALPENVEQVQAILRLCDELKVPVVARGAGTGLSGGALPHNQMLPFEPPHWGDKATLGGTIACNLSGPRRAYAGAARDFILGTQLLNGRCEILTFGGEVMKNVAGYDVSRLMCGAMGTLGILLKISLKVLPLPQSELTLSMATDARKALNLMHEWGQKPYPITATCYDGDSLTVRLSGEERAVRAACKTIGGDTLDQNRNFWQKLREHQHGFFDSRKPLWRLSLASDTAPLDLPGKWLYEWGGAQRWLISEAPASDIRAAAKAAGGHATSFRGNTRVQVFQPLPAGLMRIHQRLKQAFDPEHLFNPGRLYEAL